MSRRTVSRFALVGLLGMSLAAPAAAQNPPDVRVRVLETRTGSFVFSGSFNTDTPVELAPMPRAVGGGLRISVGTLGPLPIALDFGVPLNDGPLPRVHLQQYSVGVFGGPEAAELAPMPRLAEKHGEIRFEIQLGGPRAISLDFEFKRTGELLRAPSPRPVPVVRVCAEEEIFSTEGGRVQIELAPMPREKHADIGTIEFGIELGGGPVLFGRGPGRIDFTPAAAAPARGDFQFFTQEVLPGQIVGQPAFRFAAPGCCNEGNFCVPLNGGPAPAPQQVATTPGYFVLDERGFEIFQSPTANLPHPMLVLNAVRCDGSGAWWVESYGVPQPKHSQRVQLRPFIDPRDCPKPVVGLAMFQRDESGTWWVQADRVPQPKHSSVQQIRPCCEAAAQTAKPACCSGGSCCGTPATAAQPACCTGKACCVDAEMAARLIVLQTPMKREPLKESAFAGTWVRDLDGMVIAATLSPCGEDLKLCLSQNCEGHTLCLTVTADCKVMKEGLVHGVITGVDLDVKRDRNALGDSPLGNEMAETSLMLQQMVDCPFSFRVKHTSAGLMVSNLKLPTIGGVAGPELAMIGGMFKPCKDGVAPVAKPTKVRVSDSTTLPSGRYLEGHYPQYFSPDPQHPLPRELASQEAVVAPAPRACPAPTGCGMPATQYPPVQGVYALPPCLQDNSCPPRLPGAPQAGWTPAKPVNVPAGEFGMMAEVFGQMMAPKPQMGQMLSPPSWIMMPPQPLQPAGGFPLGTPAQPGCGVSHPSMLPPAPAPVANSMPGQPQEFTCVQDPPLFVRASGPPTMLPPPVAVQTLGYTQPPMPAPAMPMVTPRPAMTGTWVREVGPVVYVVTIAPDHLTITAQAATEVADGKRMTQEIVLTADYHATRDGTTLVGLITGVDATVGGELTDEQMPEMQNELSRMQKAYTDKPFAIGVRVYGNALVIGNVRLPQVEGADDNHTPLGILGGRYKNATDKPLPKPRAMKPSPRGLPPDPPIAGAAFEAPYGLPPGVVPGPITAPPFPARGPQFGPPPCPQPRFGPPTVCPAPGVIPPATYSPPIDDRIPPPAPHASQPAVLPSANESARLPEQVRLPGQPGASYVTLPSPRASQPAVPPMAVPTPPAIEDSVRETTKKPQATDMTTLWKNRVESLPDPTRNDQKGPGLTGQVFLFDCGMKPTTANGKLIVAVYDETPRPAGQSANPPEGWEFDKKTLQSLAMTDERFGQCYAIFLPWPTYRSDVTRVRIAVRYEPENGYALYATETKLTLEPPAKPDSAPTSSETPKPKKKKKKEAAQGLPGVLLNQYSSDPNVLMQQLLYQSADLGGIKNEWRRFWFNDQPRHLTPERIHGGIY